MQIVEYFLSNASLLFLSVMMVFLAIVGMRMKKKEGKFFIIFTALVLLLSVVVGMENYAERSDNPVIGTIFTSMGYMVRPILMYIFVLLATFEDNTFARKQRLILAIPLFINTLIYIFPLFMNVPGLSTFVFYYESVGGAARFVRGSFVNFFCHFVCLLYLLLVVYIVVVRARRKYRRDSIILLISVLSIIIAVVLEMVFKRNDILNMTCEICALMNYIFIMTINSSKDSLTKISDRRTYYADLAFFRNSINGIIEMDMNGLKWLNDHYGHEKGDDALRAIATILSESIQGKNMYLYRLSGDEFLILMRKGNEAILEHTVEEIRKKITEDNYSLAIGYCFIDKEKITDINVAFKEAENRMYEDKAKYYKDNKFDRRVR